jgi:hypothetical protein
MKTFLLSLTLVIVISGCEPQNPESYCKQDSDCACGVHVTTGECFYGNEDYVDTSRQCPDFCTGIAGNLEII